MIMISNNYLLQFIIYYNLLSVRRIFDMYLKLSNYPSYSINMQINHLIKENHIVLLVDETH